MLKINTIKAIKLILLLALINSSISIGLMPQGLSIVRISIFFILLASVILLMIFFFKAFKRKKTGIGIHLYFKILLFLLFFWSLFTILRSVSLQTEDLLALFGHQLFAWAWITPLAIVFGLNIFNWIAIFDYLGKLLLIGVALSFFFIILTGKMYTFGIVEWLQFFPILLLTYFYQNPFYKKVVFFTTITFIIVSILNSQRINAIYIILTGLFFIVEFLKHKRNSLYKKTFVSLFLALFVLFISLQISTLYNGVMQNKEASIDTRTFLFVEMFNDMSELELLIGRGALGTYSSPYFTWLQGTNAENKGDSGTRSVNEVGYLEMILKGGYIMMVLNLLILIPAMYLGIFKSKNIVARMSGYVILLYLITWIISYYPIYSAEYILLWMAVGTSISKISRKVKDSDLIVKKNNNYIFGIQQISTKKLK